MKRMGDKREMTPSNTSAISQVNEIVKGLGFKQEELTQAKQDLSHFMPKEGMRKAGLYFTLFMLLKS
jgi:hypothetical protein